MENSSYSECAGLSTSDKQLLPLLVADLFDGLVAQIEYMEDGAAFCRVYYVPSPEYSAFLLERDEDRFLLTNNVSDPLRHVLTWHNSPLEALNAAKRAVDRSTWDLLSVLSGPKDSESRPLHSLKVE